MHDAKKIMHNVTVFANQCLELLAGDWWQWQNEIKNKHKIRIRLQMGKHFLVLETLLCTKCFWLFFVTS